MRTLKEHITLFATVINLSGPAFAMSESEYQERLCAGMLIEWALQSGGRVDCVSATHAIEVDFTSKWHQAIGQASTIQQRRN